MRSIPRCRTTCVPLRKRPATQRDVHAVVIYGGDKVFAAGADIKEMAAMSVRDMADRVDALQGAFNAVAEISKPVVAAVTGYALGGGCELALGGRLSSLRRRRKTWPTRDHPRHHSGSGWDPTTAALDWPGQGQRPHLLRSGHRRQRKHSTSAWSIKWWRTTRCLEAAQQHGRRFVGGPALALRAAKRAIDVGGNADLHTGLQIERNEFAALFGTADRTSGMDSFVADGPGKATFTGE